MCGKYYLDSKRDESLIKILKKQVFIDVFPGKKAPVIIKKDGKYQVIYMKWGYPMKDKNIYNARLETVLEKDFFISVYHNRCLVPVSGYYEWNANKQTFKFERDKPFYLAGIYNNGCFCIITSPANSYVEHIHNRMPLVLLYDNVDLWLSDDFDKCLKKQDVRLNIEAVKI